ncbi:MAG: RNA polymerase factor sigma-54 [Gammaproteobacteria bacterium]
MKQSLQLRLSQQLTMTPQLQQAIRLLQLSTLDLHQEIQQVLDSNMMLELADDEPVQSDELVDRKPAEPVETTSEGSQTEIPEELPVDTSWEDVYDNVQPATSASSGSDMQDFETYRTSAPTLINHLLWQMELAKFSEHDRAIAIAIIDSINPEGYLTSSVEEIHLGLLTQMEDLEIEEVRAVLHSIQNFDPPGVAAVDLADCLRIQLSQLGDDVKWKKPAIELVTHFLDQLAAQNQPRLKRLLELNDEELNEVIALIRSLNPRPGSAIQSDQAQYVIPDVFVAKNNGRWQVSLNPDIAPKLRVNPYYSAMIKRADNSADNACLRNHLQEARWFLKSLQSRSDTLLKVARCIVERQKDFLDHGPIAMKPMVLRDVAEEVEMHESTISRVTTQKYMHTPKGIYEFKYFFSSHVSTNTGGECSSTAIRAFIEELINSEPSAKPLSDHKISLLLKEKGINVARRTIAKYREAMAIPPSNERRRIL